MSGIPVPSVPRYRDNGSGPPDARLDYPASTCFVARSSESGDDRPLRARLIHAYDALTPGRQACVRRRSGKYAYPIDQRCAAILRVAAGGWNSMIRKETESRPSRPLVEPSLVDEGPAPRRTFLASLATIVLGTVAIGTPLVAGLAMFLDPLIRRGKGAGEAGGAGKFTRITTLDALPLDGSPVQFAIMEDKVDAWNREANQPVGSIFLRRLANQVFAFNAVCPHAGCYVAYAVARSVFRCPCHNSCFHLDGTKLETPEMANPSPRPLDALDIELRLPGVEKPVDEKAAALSSVPVEVWVRFQNFKAGTAQKIAD